MTKFFVPPHIQSLRPYVPGRPIAEVKRELGLKRVIKLASNENALGTSPKVRRAVQKSIRDIALYSDPAAYDLRMALSRHHDVLPEELIFGNGSDEVLQILFAAWADPKTDAIAMSQYGFQAYEVNAHKQGFSIIKIAARTESFEPSGDDIIASLQSNPQVKIMALANPNNPTGVGMSALELLSMLQRWPKRKDGSFPFLLLDLAYEEYWEDADKALIWSRRAEFPFLTLIKTFSKAYGLGGARVGYAVGPREAIAVAQKVRLPFNISSFSLAAAQAALADQKFVRRAVAHNERERARLGGLYQKFGLTFLPSGGNFFLLKAPLTQWSSGSDLAQEALLSGIILRPVANYGLPEWVRVSIGSVAENNQWVRFLRKRVAL